MQTFDMALYNLYKEGRISLEEALRSADSKNNLRLRINLDENPAAKKKAEEASQGGGKQSPDQKAAIPVQAKADSASQDGAGSMQDLSLVSLEDDQDQLI